MTTAHLLNASRPPVATTSPVTDYLTRLHAELGRDTAGVVADYIPQLGLASPSSFGISLVTVDGTSYEVGDSRLAHTIQSMSKPFTYGLALAELGRARVLQQVGVEPTGEAFNSIVLDDVNNRPFNPMVNAGAIAVAELIPGGDPRTREANMLDLFSSLAGRRLEIDQEVYQSERDTGHRNRAIAYMMLNNGMIKRDPEDVLDLYFRQCAVLVTAHDMAVMAATLANHGTNPITGERVFAPDVVRDILTLMSTCGMYNYAGEWAYEVGIPAKSGVSGGVIAVIPGQLGIAVLSPPLDPLGNSVRGVEVCRRLSEDFALHAYCDRTNVGTVIRRHYRADAVTSKRMRSTRARDALRERGGQIAVLEVQGALFFGSAEVLARRMTSAAQACPYVVIDFRRATQSDQAADRLIIDTLKSLVASGCTPVLTQLRDGGALSGLAGAIGKAMAHAPELAGVAHYDDTDTALEILEDRLLADLDRGLDLSRLSLSALDLFEGIAPEALSALERLVQAFTYDPREVIVREGDAAQMVFIVVSGSVSIQINLPDGSSRRISSVGPGFSFGEMALLDDARRSADVIADEKTLCYGFSVAGIRDLAQSHPSLYSGILGNLVRSLSGRLRLANEEIRALE